MVHNQTCPSPSLHAGSSPWAAFGTLWTKKQSPRLAQLRPQAIKRPRVIWPCLVADSKSWHHLERQERRRRILGTILQPLRKVQQRRRHRRNRQGRMHHKTRYRRRPRQRTRSPPLQSLGPGRSCPRNTSPCPNTTRENPVVRSLKRQSENPAL